jgi:transcriptional regulator GlxA family with amidase domain
MFGRPPDKKPIKIAFLLIPDFSMIAFASAIEPLRVANTLAEEQLYAWTTLTVDGAPVHASNGVVVSPEKSLADAADPGVLFVCAGVHAERHDDPVTINWLRQRATHGSPIGALCTGSLILARAGLLDGYRCTIHWENVESFMEEFPDLEVTATLFEIDRDRYTCSGGTAPLDMMVFSIAQDFRRDLALRVSDEMLHTTQRHPTDPQRMSLQHRTGLKNAKLLAAIARMEAYLESPISLHDLADQVGLSERQLERLFRTYLGTVPSRYYLELRLQRARQLLLQTSMPILQIAVACGFISASHFAKCYRRQFNHSPRAERDQKKTIVE